MVDVYYCMNKLYCTAEEARQANPERGQVWKYNSCHTMNETIIRFYQLLWSGYETCKALFYSTGDRKPEDIEI